MEKGVSDLTEQIDLAAETLVIDAVPMIRSAMLEAMRRGMVGVLYGLEAGEPSVYFTEPRAIWDRVKARVYGELPAEPAATAVHQPPTPIEERAETDLQPAGVDDIL